MYKYSNEQAQQVNKLSSIFAKYFRDRFVNKNYSCVYKYKNKTQHMILKKNDHQNQSECFQRLVVKKNA